MKLPRNEGLEQIVIAGMMNSEECFYEGISFLEKDFFTTDEHIRLFVEMGRDKEMKSARLLEKKTNDVRMKSAIRAIDSNWTNADDFFAAKEELKKIYNKRQLFYALQKVTESFETINPQEAATEIYDAVMNLELDQSSTDILTPDILGMDYLKRLYERLDNPDEAMGIPYSVTNEQGATTGLPSLDKMFNGAQGGDLIMIAAKTGAGKTAFAINLARIFSVYQNYKGYYANTEMSEDEMVSRLLAPVANVRIEEMLYGRMDGSPNDKKLKRENMTEAVNRFHKGNMIMSKMAYLPMYKLAGLARQVKRLYGLDYLIVDYVGRMDVDESRNLWDELYTITKNMKQLAVELDIPIFMLAQRNEHGFIEGAKKMKNECDGVLMVEPVTEEDEQFIYDKVSQDDVNKVNYRILKDKVRRSDNAYPIYCLFDKSRNVFREARMR